MKTLYAFTLFFFAAAQTVSFAQVPGNCLHFDGSNDRVTSAMPTVFTNIPTNDFTVEAWVKPEAGVFSRIVFAQQSTSNLANISLGTSYQIFFYVVDNGTTVSFETSTFLTANTWTHVCARWTASTNTAEVLFDGVVQAGGAGGGTSNSGSNVMNIGSRPDGAQFFQGGIDEVRIWNTARTDCEILSNMNASLVGTIPNLEAYYNFDQGTAGGTNTTLTTLPDIVAGSYNGTVTNFSLSGSTSNWIASGATINSTNNGSPGITVSVNQSDTVCMGGSYTFPDGSTQSNITSQVTQASSFSSPAYCDSSIVTTIEVSPADTSSEFATICSGENYTYPDGTTDINIVAPMTHVSSFQTVNGCDSSIATTIEISPVYASSELTTICSGENYTYPDGTTDSNIVAPLTHVSGFQTVNGCDSNITTTVLLFIEQTTSESLHLCSGESYTFPDGSTANNITDTVMHTSTFSNSSGCDSIINTTVIPDPTFTSNVNDSLCAGDSYTFPDETTIGAISNDTVQNSVFQTVAGCDSIINTFIHVTTVDAGIVKVDDKLRAVQTEATYQWVNCRSNFDPITGATNRTYTNENGGSFAVMVTINNCTVTSACRDLAPVGIADLTNGNGISVFPNPADEYVLLTIKERSGPVVTSIFSMSGSLLRSQRYSSDQSIQIELSDLPDGVYSIQVESDKTNGVVKVLKTSSK